MPVMLRHPARLFAVALLAFAFVALVACGDDDDNEAPTIEVRETVAGTAAPSPTTPAAEETASTTPGAPGETLEVNTPSGTDLVFEPTELSAEAGSEVMVRYTNNSTTPHNIHFFEGDDADAPSLGATTPEAGPNSVQTVSFTAPAPGTYFFQCDVHPAQMTGELTVT